MGDVLTELIETQVLPHLGEQFSRGLPVMFSGAGFSIGTRNIAGKQLPTARELVRALWPLAVPAAPIDESASLQDVYHAAKQRQTRKLTELLTRSLTVDPDSLPDWYIRYFRMAWSRAYTLNIDDLDLAAGRRWEFPRTINAVSGTKPESHVAADQHDELQIIHLNGVMDDIPHHVTFSRTQYAERLARYDPWYVILVAELLSRPIVFIGTELDEPPLWQHLELRGVRGGRTLSELRPRSYLVTPHLSPVREALLADYNIKWIPMTAETFSETILSRLEHKNKIGLTFLQKSKQQPIGNGLVDIGSLAVNPNKPTDFLLGQEPDWSDLQSGRAIERESDSDLWALVTNRMALPSEKGFIIIGGTAGSGKSTALMRVALRLAAAGHRVGWSNRASELSPRELIREMRAPKAPIVLALDDADLFGASQLSPLLREITALEQFPLVLVALRATQIDRYLNSAVLKETPRVEFTVPLLADSDIDFLIDALTDARRLGKLQGKSRAQQRELFRQQANRQLLVAMIQATSNKRFETKVMEELTKLPPIGAKIYAVVAVASAFRFGIKREEILGALGVTLDNEALNELSSLTRRRVIFRNNDGSHSARHRVIAEVIFSELEKTGQLREILVGLAFVAATNVTIRTPRTSRYFRLLQRVINHDFLLRTIQLDGARILYESLQGVLPWDSHYWLHRGSAEVEMGDIGLAENFLSSAMSLAPNDPYVKNEWAYLLFKQALAAPSTTNAQELVAEATEILEGLIMYPDRITAFPYHVLGSQGLAWSRRGIVDSRDKGKYLAKLIDHLKDGVGRHPSEEQLKKLLEDLQREYLYLAVPGKA